MGLLQPKADVCIPMTPVPVPVGKCTNTLYLAWAGTRLTLCFPLEMMGVQPTSLQPRACPVLSWPSAVENGAVYVDVCVFVFLYFLGPRAVTAGLHVISSFLSALVAFSYGEPVTVLHHSPSHDPILPLQGCAYTP